jgi:hypothetical protein
MLRLALGHPARFQLSTEDFCLHLPGKFGPLLLLANVVQAGSCENGGKVRVL